MASRAASLSHGANLSCNSNAYDARLSKASAFSSISAVCALSVLSSSSEAVVRPDGLGTPYMNNSPAGMPRP